MFTNRTYFQPQLSEEVRGGSLSSNQSRRRNTFAALMNATAAITGHRTHENPPLPLSDTDLINVDKFKVSEVNDSRPPLLNIQISMNLPSESTILFS